MHFMNNNSQLTTAALLPVRTVKPICLIAGGANYWLVLRAARVRNCNWGIEIITLAYKTIYNMDHKQAYVHKSSDK